MFKAYPVFLLAESLVLRVARFRRVVEYMVCCAMFKFSY
ncbi:hypothetical protein NRI_0069 [Neorickettsia risticii str. Illinois]|uniref:Uncharacterized protein n=1 Tax=Neorickettsia risticii (strain Illinois) TaxID=434131 RepID=C6V3V1_NEORI|nr:hypothetical protein NRI_0069 [Neorickettsia risticii str. Illinois]